MHCWSQYSPEREVYRGYFIIAPDVMQFQKCQVCNIFETYTLVRFKSIMCIQCHKVCQFSLVSNLKRKCQQITRSVFTLNMEGVRLILTYIYSFAEEKFIIGKFHSLKLTRHFHVLLGSMLIKEIVWPLSLDLMHTFPL